MEKMIFAADALAGQICLVTGASRGIGRAVFEAFLQAGAVVIGTATSEAGAAALDEAGKAFEGRGCGIVLNVCDAEASKKAVDDIVAEYGRIDVLVNNAGITKDGLVMRMKDEQWETVIETDLTAADDSHLFAPDLSATQSCAGTAVSHRLIRLLQITQKKHSYHYKCFFA